MKTEIQPILLVEDSPDDVFFMRYALRKAGITQPVHVVTDGQEAVDYLRGSGKFCDRNEFPLPTLMLLDLKLPCLTGFEVLSWLRSQPRFQRLPVFVLTGSSEERDRVRAGELGAQGYYVKPPEPPMLLAILDSLKSESTSAGQAPRRQAAA